MRTVRLKALLALCMTCFPLIGYSADTDRIEEILKRKTYSPDGQLLLSEVHAHVEGCTIQLELERARACNTGPSFFFSKTDYIDVRVLVANRDAAEFRDFSGTPHESLKSAVTYRYRSLYDRLLRFANNKEQQITDEEYENFPTDGDSRLRVLSERYSKEIDPNFYSRSYEITRFCSGVEIKNPLRSGWFSFYVAPSEANEFAILLEKLSQDCVGEAQQLTLF